MNEHRHFVHSDFPHLSSDEWDTVQRMVESVGTDIVGAMLTMLDITTKRTSIFAFVQRESTVAHQQVNLSMQEQRETTEAHQQVYLLMQLIQQYNNHNDRMSWFNVPNVPSF